jgi:hypothetical protein
LLTDELTHAGRWPTVRPHNDHGDALWKRSRYGDAEFLNQALRLQDLLPRRSIGLVLLLLVGAAIIVGLEAAYDWMSSRAGPSVTALTTLDLNAKGSLGQWFCSLTLLSASGVAMITYKIRRHRLDDYQGRYHVWLWAAGCGFLIASDQAANLREAFCSAMIGLTGSRLFGDGAIWWISVWLSTCGPIGWLSSCFSLRPFLGVQP